MSRLKWRDARSKTKNLCKEFGEHHRAPLEFFTVKPWEKGFRKVSVFQALSSVSARGDNVNTIKIAAEKRTIKIGADFNIYTDGSASGGLLDGGAGVVVPRGSPTLPEFVNTIRRKCAYFTCSYEEDKRALEKAVHWLETGMPQNYSVVVFTDSQFLYTALIGNSTG